ncbi:MAG TPA: OmpH family outer membrane protein [Fimbriiglobus sp.]|jgi:Skp family chaperone for outer membrane proteins|nr:OmpH family outer membrane protein [Fimbriiglobus sp.]
MVRRIGPAVAAASLLGVGFVAGGLVAPRVPAYAAVVPGAKTAESDRVGYVFVPKVVNEADRARKHGEQIRTLQGKFAVRADFLRRALQAQQSELAGATGGDRADRERDLVKCQRELEDLDREARREVEGVQRKLIALLYQDVARAVAEVAKENGLAAVHTYTASPGTADPVQIHGLLAAPAAPIYVRPDADFTADVLKRMNKRYEVEGGE